MNRISYAGEHEIQKYTLLYFSIYTGATHVFYQVNLKGVWEWLSPPMWPKLRL